MTIAHFMTKSIGEQKKNRYKNLKAILELLNGKRFHDAQQFGQTLRDIYTYILGMHDIIYHILRFLHYCQL